MTPGWKIAREARRLFDQIRVIILQPYFKWKQFHYEMKRESLVSVTQGLQPMENDLVIFLLYQPNGIPASVLHTLDNIASQRMAAMVVLNSDISDEDYNRIKSRSALIMKRPNFGYDFGGYRDAVMYCLDEKYSLNTITLLNDSIWFPVFKECDHLSRMREKSASLVGYVYSHSSKRRKNAHVQSYFFMFRGAQILDSSDFKLFWRNLRLSDSRHFTIRNSELKMTRYFLEKEFEVGWLFSSQEVKYFYEECSYRLLEETRQYLKLTGHKTSSMLENCEKQENVRGTLLECFDEGSVGRNVIAFEPGVLFLHARFGALKKSHSKIYELQRSEILRRGIVDTFDDCIAAEVRERDEF